MTFDVTIVGAGPAGFSVAATLLEDGGADLRITLIDRAEKPDGLLRHGPAAGEKRLRVVARWVDQVLGDSRVDFAGNITVGDELSLDELRRTAHAVVLATGTPLDLPLGIAGRDSVGVGTIGHVEAWLAGSADVDVTELDLDMDTAVILGVTDETLAIAELLCGHRRDGLPEPVRDRLATAKLRYVQLVGQRSQADIVMSETLPDNLVVRPGLTPVGVVGRNRARALRCLHEPDRYGRVVSVDLRAQLLLRPRTESFRWTGLDENAGRIDHRDTRVLRAAAVVEGLYVAGWAGRGPHDGGSHSADAAAVTSAIRWDRRSLPSPQCRLVDVLAGHRFQDVRLQDWSAVAATDELLDRFAGEGQSPLVDYDALLDQVDED
ncbi:FAD-dependent oxidoreductase [Mycolicibacter sinensis]|uniref:FAD-dependent oxidoreductase n=1 Tax=Mycolicibacter sinensis (strain JDM601) TaxID=875328 RepID=UPI001300CAD3|nr:FAD-dependent oxidoreductase [Mycolicibacter sinensis]